MTKAKIVERLLGEGNITAEEAVILLTEKTVEVREIDRNPFIGPGVFPTVPYPFEINGDDDMVPYGEICSCNPKNGGSGICGCVMGNTMVPRKRGYGNLTNNGSDIKLTNNGCKNGNVCFCDGSCKEDKNGSSLQ